MKREIKRLPEAELEIMLVLWDAKTPVLRNYFDQQLRERKNWADSTILSLLSRLTEKQFISVEKQGNRNVYTALVQQKEYLALENNAFLQKLYNNSLKGLILGMVQTAAPLSSADIDELQVYLETLKERET